jgi:hypothetical protein
MEDMRRGYAKVSKRRGDKQPFLSPKIILIACALIIGFTLWKW